VTEQELLRVSALQCMYTYLHICDRPLLQKRPIIIPTLHICTCTFESIYLAMYVYIYICVGTHTCMYIYAHTCIHKNKCRYIYIYIFTYVYMYTYLLVRVLLTGEFKMGWVDANQESGLARTYGVAGYPTIKVCVCVCVCVCLFVYITAQWNGDSSVHTVWMCTASCCATKGRWYSRKDNFKRHRRLHAAVEMRRLLRLSTNATTRRH